MTAKCFDARTGLATEPDPDCLHCQIGLALEAALERGTDPMACVAHLAHVLAAFAVQMPAPMRDGTVDWFTRQFAALVREEAERYRQRPQGRA